MSTGGEKRGTRAYENHQIAYAKASACQEALRYRSGPDIDLYNSQGGFVD